MSNKVQRLFPWVNPEEWKQVFDWLFHEEKEMRKKGIQRVSAWKARGKVPVAVDSTATLVDVMIQDCMLTGNESQSNDSYDNILRLTYTMALIRFVNGIVDSLQKGTYARSVQSLANQLNLPSWLVDLRHDGTHSSLPSLSVCRIACGEALWWLRDNYWERRAEEKGDKSSVDHVSLLRKYAGAQAKILAAEAKGQKAKRGALQDIIQLLVEGSSHVIGRNNLLTALLANGAMIPNDESLRPSAIGSISCECSASYDIWYPLLVALSQSSTSFLPSLITCMAEILIGSDQSSDLLDEDQESPERASYRRTVASWMVQFLQQEEKNEEIATSLTVGFEIRNSLLTTCMKHPNAYTSFLIPLLTAGQPFEHQKNILKRASLHYTADKKEDANTLSEIVVTEEEIMKLVSLKEEAMQPIAGRRWQRVGRDHWRGCAIGSLPSNKMPPLALPHILNTYLHTLAATTLSSTVKSDDSDREEGNEGAKRPN
eukprot:Ihof_evm2s90 gene=Ihof_evmTU2s90